MELSDSVPMQRNSDNTKIRFLCVSKGLQFILSMGAVNCGK